MNNDPQYLIVRFLSNEATPEEHEVLFNWINQDPKNHKTFEEYYFLWHKKSEGPPTFQTQGNLQKLNARIDALENHEKKKSIYWWPRVAAAAMLLISVGVGFWFAQRESNASPREIAFVVKTGAPDRSTRVKLSDGSVVKLNTGSTLRFPEKFNGDRREVFLTGEGFFDIRKDPEHPFIVHHSQITTEVLGTSFNIKDEGSHSIVTVATGRVKVTGGAQSKIVTPHQKAVYNPQARSIEVTKTSTTSELCWMENTIIFEDTDLPSAAKKLEEWFNVTIQFENAGVRNCRITGKFKNESLEHILEAISFSTGIKFAINKNTVLLSGNGC